MPGGPSTSAFSDVVSCFKAKSNSKQTVKGRSLADVPCSDFRGADRGGGGRKDGGGGEGLTAPQVSSMFIHVRHL